MAKKTELLINVVIMNRPKLLTGLTQNGNEVELFIKSMEHTVQRASGEKAEPKLSASIQGNVVSLYILRQSGTLTVRKADGVWR